MDALTHAMLAIPDPVKWALALVGVALGLLFIVAPDAVIRGLRRWLLRQLRWLRRPNYRRLLKLYGWLLFVTGALLVMMLLLGAGR